MNKTAEIPKKVAINIIEFVYDAKPYWCCLEDCNKLNCHNCYPVNGCTTHKKCIREGPINKIKEHSEVIYESLFKNNYK
mgnify:CR=1 FL=1